MYPQVVDMYDRADRLHTVSTVASVEEVFASAMPIVREILPGEPVRGKDLITCALPYNPPYNPPYK